MPKSILDKARIEIRWGPYGTAPATALYDPSILPRVQDYRRQSGSRMYPLGRDEIVQKIPESEYHVSRKFDGEFNVIVYDQEQLITINPGGTIRSGMPWQLEAARRLKDAGIREAMIAGELYATNDENRRERVHDVISLARQPKAEQDLQRLQFAVFDLISINHESFDLSFNETWQKIESMFAGGEQIHSVPTVIAKTAREIDRLFARWVVEENSEGLVVRSDSVGNFKIKPRHTLDAAVIGFTESSDDRTGMLHDLLLAIVRGDGALQVLSRVGGGFSDDARRELLSDLKDMVVESEYAEVNSDHVAYQMVAPKMVVEISFLDLISQTTRGGPVNRMVLHWNRAERRYEVIRRLPLCSVISPQFVRQREDKQVNPGDVRIGQIADLVDVPMAERDASRMTLPKSTPLKREVYTKILKGEKMVRKFLMWKTNKESEHEDFPAYVIHYTDFSPARKIPLIRDIRVSNRQSQIDRFWNQLREANIKQGWERADVGNAEALVKSVVEESNQDPEQPTTRPSTKVTARKPAKSSTKTAGKAATKKKARKKVDAPAKAAVKKAAKKTAKKAAGKKRPAAKTAKAATKKSPRVTAKKTGKKTATKLRKKKS